MSSLADTRDAERRISYQGTPSASEMWQCLFYQITAAPNCCYSIGSHQCSAYLPKPFGRRRTPRPTSSRFMQHHHHHQNGIAASHSAPAYFPLVSHTASSGFTGYTRTPPPQGLPMDSMESLGRGAWLPRFRLVEVFLATTRRCVFAAIGNDGRPMKKACR